MLIEFAVLDGFECIHQDSGDRIRFDQQPVLMMSSENAPQAHRLKAQQHRAFTVRILERVDATIAKPSGVLCGRIEPVPESESPCPERDPVRLDAVLSRPGDGAVPLESQLIENHGQFGYIEGQADV